MTDAEQTVADLRAELEEVTAERNRLWAELELRKANQQELDYLRQLYGGLSGSLSWRLTAPLRAVVRVARDPVASLKRLVRKVAGRRS